MKGRIQNDALLHQSPHGGMSSLKYILQCLCPPSESQLPPVSLGHSPLSTSEIDPRKFQITTSILDTKYTRYCIHSLRLESLFPSVLWCSRNKPHWPSKPNILRAYLLKARPPDLEAWFKTWTLHSLERTCPVLIIFPFVGCSHGGMSLDCTMILLLLPSCCGFFLSSRSFLLVFCFSHQ